jgi:ribonuclease P protein component
MPLAKQCRIVHDKDIKQTYLTRYKSRNSLFQTYLRVSDEQQFKLLVVVSKKVHKKANLRNRVRRRISAIFEKLNNSNRLPKNVSAIIQIKSPLLLLLSHDLLHEQVTSEVSKLYIQTLQKQTYLDKKPRVHGKYIKTKPLSSQTSVEKHTDRIVKIHT